MLVNSHSKVLKQEVSDVRNFVGDVFNTASVDGKRRLVTYKEWGNLLQTSFEACYYVPLGE